MLIVSTIERLGRLSGKKLSRQLEMITQGVHWNHQQHKVDMLPNLVVNHCTFKEYVKINTRKDILN